MANVLIIEPNRVLARTYQAALQQAGHAVRISPTAQTAILSADEQKPDVVVLELQLVANSGVEFLYEFRSYVDWQDVPVIILSQVPPARLDADPSTLQTQFGITHYLYKPLASLRSLQTAVLEVSKLPT